MEMEGIEMDDALPQKRWKKELGIYILVLVLVSLVLSEPTQYQHVIIIIIIRDA